MRPIKTVVDIPFPSDVTFSVKARCVRVSGPRGELVKSFKHQELEIRKVGPSLCRVIKWHGTRKQIACVGTICSHIRNMAIGVTKGFQYKMRLVHAHFPININLEEDGTLVEIRNFLGEKSLRKVQMMEGVKVRFSENVKDEIIVEGNDVQYVSQSAARISESVLVRNKDIRKFLDGIYVSEKGNVVTEY